MHTSIPLELPIEFIELTPVNPLISKCQIKVCYVDDKPNRNRSIITKEVARQMANSLPGSPIVGYYNENKQDFEEHNRVIEISDGQFKMRDTTKPYGFVDLSAKVWFQKFLDDGEVEREYLVTEGYLWTGQYPECSRIIEKGNNQSMELDEKTINATWTKDDNGKPKFFIINEAIISKLCILGEECEPCFEGAGITEPKLQFSFDEDFKQKMFSMITELKELINEGGAKKVFNRYAVEIGDTLWSVIYNHLDSKYPDVNNCYCSMYRIDGIFEEEGQKFVILQHRLDMKYYRLNFSLTDEEGFSASEVLVEVTKTYVPAAEPQFAQEAVDAFEAEFAKKNKSEEDKEGKEDNKDSENNSEGEGEKEEAEEKCPECGKPIEECTCEEEKEEENKKKYSLEEIPEYVELQTKFADLEAKYVDLETSFSSLKVEKETLEATLTPLVEFKAAAEKKEKEAMIDSFYMLSDEDKANVRENIDTYSLEDIEAKLSIICVRNKVNFNLDEDNGQKNGPTTFNLEDSGDDAVPAWVKRAMSVAKTLK